MSFLNPVNEPVLRFSSTDADAPQINYTTRVAGDIKTVLKACLVTGYGDKASAGWSIVNEVDHVAEFVSPSAAMSDYRLGIDDSSAASTTWYYQYQDIRKNPVSNVLGKAFPYANKSSVSNGWQLLVTARGIFFVEILNSSVVSKNVARLSYWGAIKSTLINDLGRNIGYWSIGLGAPEPFVRNFFNPADTSKHHYVIGDYSSTYLSASNIRMISEDRNGGAVTTDITSPLYLGQVDVFVGEHPGLLLSAITDTANQYGAVDTTIDTRPVLSICLGNAGSSAGLFAKNCRTVMVRLDYWGY